MVWLVKTVGWPPALFCLFAFIMAILGFVLFAYVASKTNKWATKVDENEFKYLMASGTLIRVLWNLKDAGLDKHGNVTEIPWKMQPVYYNPLLNLMSKRLGVFWVSALYPIFQLLTFKIDKKYLLSDSDLPENHTTKDYIETVPNFEVDSLRRYFPRPNYTGGVELGDQWKIDVVTWNEYEVTSPYRPIFRYKGKFFPVLDAATEASVNDVVNLYPGYEKISKEPTGSGSKFSEAMVKKLAPLDKTVGIVSRDSYIVHFELDKSMRAQLEAAVAQETERLEGEGVKARADARAYEITTLGKAQADMVLALATALKAGGTPDDGLLTLALARVLSSQAIASPDSKVTYYAEGGSNNSASVSLPSIP
jgi:hypothetical protein